MAEIVGNRRDECVLFAQQHLPQAIKPLDVDAVLDAAARSSVIVTVEEHNILGGLGAAVAEVLAEHGSPARLVRHGIKDEYSLIGPPTHLYGHYRLDAPGIESVIREQLR